MPVISIAMIVRDEEQTLPRAIKSIEPLLASGAELVIVDTGSVDKTVEIAKSRADHFTIVPWTGDFSYHRNDSFKKCSGDWILGFDADEEFELNCRADQLIEILQNVPEEINTLSVVVKDIRQGNIASETDSVRFFRSGSTTWTRKIHNKPIFDGKTAPIRVAEISHYGYDLTPEQAKKKSQRTINGLLEMLEDDPDDYENLFYLSQAYAVYDDNEKLCLKYGEAYIAKRKEIDFFNPAIYYLIGGIYLRKKQYEKLSTMLVEAMKAFPGNPDLYWRNLQMAVNTNDQIGLSRSAQLFVAAFDNIDNYRIKYPGAFFFTTKAEFLVQALYYLAMGHFQHAQGSLKRIIDMGKNFDQNTYRQIEETVINGMKQFGVTSNLVEQRRIVTLGGNHAHAN